MPMRDDVLKIVTTSVNPPEEQTVSMISEYYAKSTHGKTTTDSAHVSQFASSNSGARVVFLAA